MQGVVGLLEQCSHLLQFAFGLGRQQFGNLIAADGAGVTLVQTLPCLNQQLVPVGHAVKLLLALLLADAFLANGGLGVHKSGLLCGLIALQLAEDRIGLGHSIMLVLERLQRAAGVVQSVYPRTDVGDVIIPLLLLQLLDGFLGLSTLGLGLLDGLQGIGQTFLVLCQVGGIVNDVLFLFPPLVEQGHDLPDGIIHGLVRGFAGDHFAHFIGFFLLIGDVGACGAQGGAEAVKLVLQPGLLTFQLADAGAGLAAFLEVLAGVGSGVPVLDQGLLGLVCIGHGFGLLLLETLALLGHVLVDLLLAVEPLGHGGGPPQLALDGLVVATQFAHFIVDSGLLVFVHRRDVFHLAAQDFALVLLLLAHLVDLFAHLGIDLGAGHLLQQVGLLVFVAVEEFGEFALGKHHGAEELDHVEPDDFMDVIFDFFNLGKVFCRHDTVCCLQASADV